jgi:UDP-N-acetylmuramoyl-L-alanyl-D-glutamate--2,6-diaminopimelate ligase
MQPAWTEAPHSVPLVLVDYAHTPDAVAQALNALQPLAQHRGGQLWCVLGCGGDRDKTKRPLMAAAAQRGADHVVLTSDNPRTEDPQAILQDMLAGLEQPEQVHVELDRQKAIAWVVEHAQPQDVVLLAGKGHEEVQEVAGVKRPFSDVQEARKAMQRRALPVTGGAL